MSKYHISKKGLPEICRAIKRPCPLGEHFETEAEAYKSLHIEMSQEYGLIPNVCPKTYEEQYKIVMSKGFKSPEAEDRARTKLAKLSLDKSGVTESSVKLDEILKDIHTPDSGATISINDSNTEAVIPTVGFCASPYPEYSKVFENSKKVTAESLLNFMDLVSEKKDILSGENTYIGLWNDPSTGKVYLDISKRYDTAEEARKVCKESDQIAYFDLQTFESVDVDRTATSGQMAM